MEKLLLLCFCVAVLSQVQSTYVIDPNPPFCSRRVNLDASPDAKTITVTANADCLKKYTVVNSTSIQMLFTAGNNTATRGSLPSNTPIFGIGANFKNFPVDPKAGVQGTDYFAYLAFDQFVYYQDVDGVLGYQPEKDTVLLRQYLNDSLATNNKFDSYMKSSVDLDGNGNNYNKFTVQILREFGANFIATSMETSAMDIYPFNSTTTRKYISPNSIRFSARIDSVTNFPVGANGCAMSAIICAPTQVFKRKPVLLSGGNFTMDLPQDTNPSQTSYSLEDYGIKNSSFFSIRNSVFIAPAKKFPPFTSDQLFTEPVNLGLTVDSGLPMINATTHQFWRVWLSISKTATDTDTYVFEAAFGLDEAHVSSAYTLCLSFIVLLVVLFVY
jgi:hypothetical protein